MLDCSTREEMKRTGEKILVELYGGKETETLDSLQTRKFKDKVVRCITSVTSLAGCAAVWNTSGVVMLCAACSRRARHCSHI